MRKAQDVMDLVWPVELDEELEQLDREESKERLIECMMCNFKYTEDNGTDHQDLETNMCDDCIDKELKKIIK